MDLLLKRERFGATRSSARTCAMDEKPTESNIGMARHSSDLDKKKKWCFNTNVKRVHAKSTHS